MDNNPQRIGESGIGDQRAECAELRQWPDNICSGDIRYGYAYNYDGFYLADAMHGIPTIGSVSPTDPVTLRGQHVRVFNYPGQTEDIAKQLVHRWNCHADMLAALHNVRKLISEAAMTGFNWNDGDWADRLFASQAVTSAAVRKAETR